MSDEFNWKHGPIWVHSPDGNATLYVKEGPEGTEGIRAAGYISPILGLPRGAKAQWRTYEGEGVSTLGFSVSVEAAKEELLRCVFQPHHPLHPFHYRAGELHHLLHVLKEEVLADCRVTEDKATYDALKHLQEAHFLLLTIKHCLGERWAAGSMEYCKPK